MPTAAKIPRRGRPKNVENDANKTNSAKAGERKSACCQALGENYLALGVAGELFDAKRDMSTEGILFYAVL